MKKLRLKGYILSALFSVFITLCAWIQFPLTVPVTLQTFGIFLCLITLGGYYGSISVLAYLLLGIIGLPVFSGFAGGLSALGGHSAGYIIGFIALALIYWFFEKVFGQKIANHFGLALGLIVCYLLGALWFNGMFAQNSSFMATFITLNAPYIIPDVIKLVLALMVSNRISVHLQKIK